MTLNRSVIRWILVVIGTAAIAGELGYSIGSGGRAGRAYDLRDPIVLKALNIYGHGKVSPAKLLESLDPEIVYLPDKTCVVMKHRQPTLGGVDTMCFDKSGRFLFYYSSGA